MEDNLTFDDAWPPMQGILENEEQTPLKNDLLPWWAEPREREENYHHVIRRLFETTDFQEIEVYGPEANIGGTQTDILLDISPPEDKELGVSEFIAIEVKTDPEGFENSDNLDQLNRQVKTKRVDRLYACTPTSEDETRLDIDPKNKQLIRRLEFADFQRSLRGLEGKIRGVGEYPLPKPAAYQKLFSESREKFIQVAKQHNDWEHIKRNLENDGNAALPNKWHKY